MAIQVQILDLMKKHQGVGNLIHENDNEN